MDSPKEKLTNKQIIVSILIHLGIFTVCSPAVFTFFFVAVMAFGESYHSNGFFVNLLGNLFIMGAISLPFFIGFLINYLLTKKLKFNVILLVILLILYHVLLKVVFFGF